MDDVFRQQVVELQVNNLGALLSLRPVSATCIAGVRCNHIVQLQLDKQVQCGK